MNEDQLEQRVKALLSESTRRRGYGPASLGSALKLLQTEDDSRCFKQLQKEHETQVLRNLVLERFGQTRARATATTPDLIKNLRPDVPGCWLVWQQSKGTYEGYYPRAAGPPAKNKKGKKVQTHHTIARTFARTYLRGKYSPLEALVLVVNGLWKMHGKDVSGRPTREMIREAFERVANGEVASSGQDEEQPHVRPVPEPQMDLDATEAANQDEAGDTHGGEETAARPTEDAGSDTSSSSSSSSDSSTLSSDPEEATGTSKGKAQPKKNTSGKDIHSAKAKPKQTAKGKAKAKTKTGKSALPKSSAASSSTAPAGCSALCLCVSVCARECR
ncbi:HMCN1 [Symbiodinium sp. CCMP2592]|nr:HMCN1 [Symbiodinium sp. CCMP2592]